MSESKRQRKLRMAREWKQRNPQWLKSYAKKRWERIKRSPALLAKKKIQDAASFKRHYSKRRAYDQSRDKVKLRARGTVRNHVFHGKLKRQPCEKCGKPNAHAHHEDYTKPLQIKWLCAKHHKELHNGK